MEQSLAEIADKYTILKRKSEHGLNVVNELKEYTDALSAHQKKLGNVDCSELRRINTLMWEIEQQIGQEDSLREIGRYCLALRTLNSERVKAKNRITNEFGGRQEKKSY